MKNKIKNFKIIVSVLNIPILLIVAVFIAKINSLYTQYEIKVEQFEQLKNEIKECLKQYDNSNTIISVYIKDLSTKHTIDIESEQLLPAASLLKIPIMAAVYYLVDKEKLSLDEIIVYKKRHRCGGSGIIKNMPYGSKFTIKMLIELMISMSDNVATHMLIERVGIQQLNKIFHEELGLENTNINRYIMDLCARNKGIENYTTAKDIGVLLEKIYYGKLVSEKASIEMLSCLMRQKISDRIPRLLPKEIVVAHKTGLMKNVCHDAGIVFTNKGDFIICVLTKNVEHTRAKRIISELAYKAYCLYTEKMEDQISADNTSRDHSGDN